MLINETYFIICSERRIGFRPRLARVKEDTGRSLFGKPVSQSTRQSRGSGRLLINETYFMICSERRIGFRLRLNRVKKDTGRSLFGKPVTRSTWQSRGSGLLFKDVACHFKEKPFFLVGDM